MADGGDPPKKDNPRYRSLTGESATSYYLARRYFQLNPAEWDDLPWWQTTCYLEGLKAEGVLKDPDAPNSKPAAGNPGHTASKPVNYAEDPLLPRGFKTRRAG